MKADGEEATRFHAGDRVAISVRFPSGHYRVPLYIRGKTGVVEAVIEPPAVNNEEEGFGRNAGFKRLITAWRFRWQIYGPATRDRPTTVCGLRFLKVGLKGHSVHPHHHTPIVVPDNAPGYYEIMETAVRELLIEKHLIGPDEIRRQIEVLDSRTSALGAKVVAKAWVDPRSSAAASSSPTGARPARNWDHVLRRY